MPWVSKETIELRLGGRAAYAVFFRAIALGCSGDRYHLLPGVMCPTSPRGPREMVPSSGLAALWMSRAAPWLQRSQ